MESGVELKIVGGLAMITASTLSLEEYQRHDGLQAVEKFRILIFANVKKVERDDYASYHLDVMFTPRRKFLKFVG